MCLYREAVLICLYRDVLYIGGQNQITAQLLMKYSQICFHELAIVFQSQPVIVALGNNHNAVGFQEAMMSETQENKLAAKNAKVIKGNKRTTQQVELTNKNKWNREKKAQTLFRDLSSSFLQL